MYRASILFLVAALAALAFAPSVEASHTPGHRYLVYGRILDASGMPAQGQEVMILIKDGDTYRSSIQTTTDCFGDFDAWKGERGSIQGPPPAGSGDGYGEVETVSQHNPPYVNFHFHSDHLTNRLQIELRVANETWTEGFNSNVRQTNTFHSLTQTLSPTAACGNYDAFMGNLTARVFVASEDALDTRKEPSFVPRTVNVSVESDPSKSASGVVDFMYMFTGQIGNASATPGLRLRIVTQDVGERIVTLSEEEAKFRRVNEVYIIEPPITASFAWLKWLGYIALGAAIIVGAWFGFSKLKDRMDMQRMRQNTTRRRFRKE